MNDQPAAHGSEMTGNTFTPGPTPNTVRSADSMVLTAPEGWTLLPPGDAALTRRVKAAGDHRVVQEKRATRSSPEAFGHPQRPSRRLRVELEVERPTEGYAKRKDADSRRRDEAQAKYVEDFYRAVLAFLAFHPPARRSRPAAGPCCCQSRHAGRQRHGCQDEANPGRTACRSGPHCLATPPNHGLRLNEDPQNQRQATGGSTSACAAIPGVAGRVSKGRGCWRRLPTEEGVELKARITNGPE